MSESLGVSAGDASSSGEGADPMNLPWWMKRVSSAIYTVPVGPEPDELLVRVRRLLRASDPDVGPVEAALLDQLAAAVKPSGSFRGSFKDTGTGAPANLDAIDTWKLLDKWARDINQKHGRSMRGPLGHLVAQWPREFRSEKRRELTALLGRMIDRALDVVAPQVPRRPIPHECTNCGAFWVWDSELQEADEDKTYALSARDRDPETGNMLRPEQMDVACAVCERVWSGDELRWLLQVLSNQWAGGYSIGERMEQSPPNGETLERIGT